MSGRKKSKPLSRSASSVLGATAPEVANSIGGTFITRLFRDRSAIKFIRNHDTVVAVYVCQGQKYFYYISLEDYYRLKRFDDDSFSLYGRGLSSKRFLNFCKRHSLVKDNENI